MQPTVSLLTPSAAPGNATLPNDGGLARKDQSKAGAEQPASFASVMAAGAPQKGQAQPSTLAEPDTPDPESDAEFAGQEGEDPHTADAPADEEALFAPDTANKTASDPEGLTAPSAAVQDPPRPSKPSAAEPQAGHKQGHPAVAAAQDVAQGTPPRQQGVAQADPKALPAGAAPADLWQTAILHAEKTPLAGAGSTRTALPGQALDAAPVSAPLKGVNQPIPQGAGGEKQVILPAMTGSAAPVQTPEPPLPSQALQKAGETVASPDKTALAAPIAGITSTPLRRDTREPEIRTASTTTLRTTATPFAVTQQVAPLIAWQDNVAQFTTDPLTKDLLAIDPITGEARVSAATTGPTATGGVPRAELPAHIARQLIEVVQQNPKGSVEITLKPLELGAVRMSLHQAETGIIVNLTAERPETLDLMRRNIDQLGAEFQALGYTDIAFSFAGADTDPDSQSGSGDKSALSTPEAEDPSATPSTSIHLALGTSAGVDLRL